MDDYAGRVLADRYRLPLAPSDEGGDAGAYGPVETRAFDTYSGQEVVVRQLPLPETVDAEVVEADGAHHRPYGRAPQRTAVRATADPAVQRAVEAVQAVARIPDHPRLDQVFDVFVESGSLWIVSESIAARPLADLVRAEPLGPYRAAEIAADVLTALRALHAHGWTHRNITARTVLVCDDGRVVLSGLAAGAAEEALCGYAPVPLPDDADTPYPDADGGPYGDEHDAGEAESYADGSGGQDGDAYDDGGDDGAGDAYDDEGGDAYDDEAEVVTGHTRAYDGDDPYGDVYEDPYGAPRALAPAPLPPGPPALPSGYEPQYVARVADRIADDDDGDDEGEGDGTGGASRYGVHDPHDPHDPHGPHGRHDPYGPDDVRGEEDGEGRPPHALLAGTWRDGPVPADGGG
ncbi:protein kinase, partial [Streptomyces sp. Act-28]